MPRQQNITWRLELEGDRVERGFRNIGRAGENANNRIRTSSARARRELEDFGRRIRGLGLAIVTSLGGIGFGRAIASTVQLTTEMSHLADSLSTTTSSLQLLTGVGTRVGVAFESLRPGLGDFTRRLAQAADGIGPAQAALDRLGLSARDLFDVPLDERLERVADALARVSNEDARLAIAGQLFGEEGSILVSRVARNIDQNRASLQRSGIVLSDADNRQISRLGNEFGILLQNLQGLGNILTRNLTPAMLKVVETLQDLTKALVRPIDAVSKAFGNLVDEALELLGTISFFATSLFGVRFLFRAGASAIAREEDRRRELLDRILGGRTAVGSVAGSRENSVAEAGLGVLAADALISGRETRRYPQLARTLAETVAPFLIRLVRLTLIGIIGAAGYYAYRESQQLAENERSFFDPNRGFVRFGAGDNARGASTAARLEAQESAAQNELVRIQGFRERFRQSGLDATEYESVLREFGLFEPLIEERRQAVRDAVQSQQNEEVRLGAALRFNPNARPTSFDPFGNPIFGNQRSSADQTFYTAETRITNVTEEAERRGERLARDREREARRRRAEEEREERETFRRRRERIRQQIEDNRTALQDFFDASRKLGDDMTVVFENFFDGLSSGFREFLKTGRFEFSSFFNEILLDLSEQVFRSQIIGNVVNPLFNAFTASIGLGSLFGNAPGAGTTGLSGLSGTGLVRRSLVGGIGSAKTGGYVTGEGIRGNRTYNLPLEAFANAPRFQRGGFITADGGIPTVLHPRELVLDEEQTRRYLGGGASVVNNYYTTINADNATPGTVPQLRELIQSDLGREFVTTLNDDISRGN